MNIQTKKSFIIKEKNSSIEKTILFYYENSEVALK